MTLFKKIHADLLHRRSGHMNSRSIGLPRKRDNSGRDFMGSPSECDVWHINKSQQKVHLKKSGHEMSGPMALVYTNPMGPIKSSANGGHTYDTSARLPTTSPE